jgi:hypothetical protein
LVEGANAALPVHLKDAFTRQARACAALGSPFTARLCSLVAEFGLPDGPLRQRFTSWPGDVSSDGASLPLRLVGALHWLALNGLAFDSIYPPQAASDADRVFRALGPALVEHEALLLEWMDSPPQTNEVRRAAIMAAGLSELAVLTPLPFRLLELGSSAGLNLALDNMAITLAGTQFGNESSLLKLKPEWAGAAPATPFTIAERHGCDIAPVDLANAADVLRLRAYVWPDQMDRLERLDLAAGIARAIGVRVDKADAVEWTRRKLSEDAAGRCTVIVHTIAVQYLPSAAQQELNEAITAAGRSATHEAPLARLGFEPDGETHGAPVTLDFWPSGNRTLLGRADFHGRWIDWRQMAGTVHES